MSSGYTGTRVIVDGALIDSHAFEFGETPEEMAGRYHANDAGKLLELVRDFDKCLDTALWLAGNAGYPVMPDQKLFDSLHPRMRDLGIEVPE